MAMDEYGLSPKQRAWCDEYIRSGNGFDAARKAGYKRPKASSEQNRDKAACKAYIAARMQPTVERRIASADEVLQFLTDVMNGKVKDQFGLDASLQDRIKAGQELMKRYAVADMRQQSTMQRLDSIFLEFRAALDSTPQPPAIELQDSPTAATTAPAGDSATTTAQPATGATADPTDSATTAPGATTTAPADPA